MYKAKEDFLWFKKDELVSKIEDNWKYMFIEIDDDISEAENETKELNNQIFSKIKPKNKKNK